MRSGSSTSTTRPGRSRSGSTQLNLLPGIGKQLRNKVLDERKRGPFESFEEVSERVTGLHHPREVLVERIVEEIHEEDLKYRRFVGYEE